MKNLHDINKKPFVTMAAKGFYVLGVSTLFVFLCGWEFVYSQS